MRKFSKYVAAGLTLCLVGSTPFLATKMADAQDAPIQVTVGGGEDDIAVNIFRAKEITVEVDTVVHFEWDYEEPHTVTFGIPTGNPTVPTPGAGTEIVNYTGTEFISSGFVTGDGEAIDIRFSTVGTYDYFCVLHPTMVGTVNVVNVGDEDADTQTEIDDRGDDEYATSLAAVKAVAAALSAEPQSVTPKANGGFIYEIVVGVDSFDSAVNRYFPKTQAITTLDTITWVAVEQTPHTVTFGDMGPPQGDPTEIEAIVPEDGVWDGTGVVHSGTLGTGWDGGTSFTLEFSEAGTYDYYCYLHVSLGQMGTVTVADPSTPTPTPSPSATAVPSTPTPAPTNTPVPTNTPMPTNTAVPTATTVPPTATTAPATNTPAPSVIPGPPNTGEGVSSSSSSSFSFLAAAGVLVALGTAGLMFATRRN